MENLKEKIQDMAHYDQCAHVPPLFFAQILEALRVLAEPTELTEYASAGKILPKVAGAFTSIVHDFCNSIDVKQMKPYRRQSLGTLLLGYQCL